jgi:hypothetical protein
VEGRPLDEAQLIARARQGDEEAYAALVKQHSDLAFRIAYQTRSGSLPVPTPVSAAAWTPWSPITAEAKRIAYGAAAISPDDRTLYSLGDLGVSAIDTRTLTVRRSLVTTTHLISLTLSPDGRWLYAATADSTAPLLQVDTEGGGWTSIAGSNQPLEVLHVVTGAS